MRIPVERLLDGLVETLRDTVLPEVSSSYARGQAYAIADVLQNLRDRVQWKSDLAEAERTSLEEVLPRAAAALGDGPGAPLAERIRSALATDAPTRDRELAAVFLETLAALDELPEEVAAAGRAVLGGHLAAHAVREVLPLKPSLLREISEG